MHIFSTEYSSWVDWLFSLRGILIIASIVFLIWLIYKFFKDRNDDDDNSSNHFYPLSKENYDKGSVELNDESYWDDLNKVSSQQGTNFEAMREEEPIPPYAIPPSNEPVKEDIYDGVNEDSFVNESITINEKENE